MLIYCVEDDESIRDLVGYALRGQGYGMADLMYTAATIQGISFQPFPPLVIVAVYYFVMTFFVSSCLRVLEIRLKVRSVR